MMDGMGAKIALAALAAALGGIGAEASAAAARSNNERIWMNKPGDPAKTWEGRVFHLGNGYFSASCDGGIREEVFTLGEKTFWTGGPGDGAVNDYGMVKGDLRDLDLIRRATAQGDFAASDQAASRLFRSRMDTIGALSCIGGLSIRFGDAPGAVTEYERSLDLATALASVRYRAGGVCFRRECFCSHPDRVLAVRLTSDRPDGVNIAVGLNLMHRARPPRIEVSAADGTIRAAGNIDGNNRPYRIIVKMAAEGGRLLEEGESLRAAGCKSVVLYYTVATDYARTPPLYRGADPDAIVRDAIRRAAGQGYDKTRERHVADYRSLYCRTDFHLENEAADREALPTDERLNRCIREKDFRDLGLKELAFNFGKYILISSSRPGALPAGLMGCWNNRYNAWWGGVYQLDMNTTQTYMFGNALNLPECQQAFIDYILGNVPIGKKLAKNYYGLDDGSWASFLISDIWGHAGICFSADYKFVSTGWLALILWEQYAFEGDAGYLRKIYPALKGAARFYQHNLVEYKDTGRLVFTGTASAEHRSPLGSTVPGFQDIAFAQETFENAIAAAEILGVDKPFREELRKTKDRLMPYKTGRFGQLQEWVEDIDDPNCKHRHISHLLSLTPCRQLNPYKHPELAKAAKVTLNHRGDADLKALRGIGSNGPRYPSRCRHEGLPYDFYTAQVWCRAARMCDWIRLFDGDRADKIYNDILGESTLGNMVQFETRENYSDEPKATPFFLDGIVLSAGYVTEMALQSQYGFLDILPALPPRWKNGWLKGVKARGGFIVDVSWKDGKLAEAVIRYGRGDAKGAVCRFRCGGRDYAETVSKGRPFVFRPQK